MGSEELLKMKIKQIPNLMCERHVEIINGLVKWLRPQVVVEIGCFQGFISANILQSLKDADIEGALIIIDNFSLQGTHPAALHNNLASCGLGENAIIYAVDSKEIPKLINVPIDLAFIDGDHSYEGCLLDFMNVANLGAKCIIIHDTVSWWGVRKFVETFETSEFSKIEVNFDEGLAIYMRVEPKPECSHTEEQFPSGAVE